jgi:hypothetical protein
MFYAKIYKRGNLIGYVEADARSKAMAIADDYQPHTAPGYWFDNITEEKPTEDINLLASWTHTEQPVHLVTARDARKAIAEINAKINDLIQLRKGVIVEQLKKDKSFTV